MDKGKVVLDEKNKIELKKEAIEIRKSILNLVYNAKSGHIGGSFSSVEILNTLFKYFLNENDKLIISKGHITPLIYTLLNKYGNIIKEELKSFRTLGSRLEGHIKAGLDDRIIYSAGSLRTRFICCKWYCNC